MNKNSNTYIIIYATVMVVVVAVALAFASLSLQGRQNANIETEMKGAILASIGQEGDVATARNRREYIQERYDRYIVDAFAVNAAGDRVEDLNAFDLLKERKGACDGPALPVFMGRDAGGELKYILPVRGSGLWGPLWGYLALEQDISTISGIVLDHQGETPGLGAEIATPEFQDQFKGKSIMRDGKLVGVAVLRGTGASRGNPNAVDAISGGTITSRGVEQMLLSCLLSYEPFLVRERAARGPTAEVIGGADGPSAILVTAAAPETDIKPINSDGDE